MGPFSRQLFLSRILFLCLVFVFFFFCAHCVFDFLLDGEMRLMRNDGAGGMTNPIPRTNSTQLARHSKLAVFS